MKFKGYILVGLMMLVTLTGCGSGFEWFPGTPVALSIFTKSLPNAVIGTPYSQTLLATGGKSPYAWTLDSGVLPDGLNLNFAGVISGTPTAASLTSEFTVKVIDSASPNGSTTQLLKITIPGTTAPLAITTTSLPNAAVGTAYTGGGLVATGGTSPYTWTLASGTLPAGLGISGSAITGTPAVGALTSNFTIKVTDTSTTPNSTTQALTITIPGTIPALSITTPSLPNAAFGTAYSATFTASGGTPPYTWTIPNVAGTGLTATGATISGTPLTTGIFVYSVQVSDSSATPATVNASYTLHTNGSSTNTPRITSSTTLSAATVGTAYSQQLTVSGGTPPYTWAISGTLPAGLTLAPSTGIISGTPTAAGTGAAFDISVKDSTTPAPYNASQAFNAITFN